MRKDNGIRQMIRRALQAGLFAVALSMLAACGAGRPAASTPPATSANTPEAPQTVTNTGSSAGPASSNGGSDSGPAAFSDATQLMGIVNFLASDELKGRDTGSEGLEKAADFLQDRLEQYGIAPYFSSYRDTLTNVKDTAYNIVGMIPGSDPALKDQFVVLGAHYDHIGIVPIKDGDGIANGANDNASGTATVLELARYLASGKPPARSILIAFFSAEERGLLGSEHLAGRLEEAGFNLYGMLNFEMTGVPMKGKSYFTYITGFDKSNLAELSNKYGGENLVGFLPSALEYNLFQRSDNFTFYERFQVPAHTYSTFDFNNYPHYHQPADEADQMDYSHMADFVNRLIPVVRGIANAGEQELIAR